MKLLRIKCGLYNKAVDKTTSKLLLPIAKTLLTGMMFIDNLKMNYYIGASAAPSR